MNYKLTKLQVVSKIIYVPFLWISYRERAILWINAIRPAKKFSFEIERKSRTAAESSRIEFQAAGPQTAKLRDL